jgi:hypothetical protein
MNVPSTEQDPIGFGHAPARLTIGSLDDTNLTITAQYNPHEIGIKKAIPWSPKGEQGKPTKPNASKQDSHEFKGASTRTMTLELLFDGYETGDSVEYFVEDLETMSSVRDPEENKPDLRRPHYCVVAWGEQGVKPFRCVITSLAVRYTMFAKDGKPLRAVCSVELSEARLSPTAV